VRKENYPKFARRLLIVTATSALALFGLMVAPSIASFAHAQSAVPGLSSAPTSVTSTDIQALKDQVNTLKSVIQTLRAQLSQLATVQSLSVFTEVGQTLSIKPGQDLDSIATCPAGTQVTGGGFSSGGSPGDPNLHLTNSVPTVNGWGVSVLNSGNTNGVFASFARCASLTTSVNR
jgi:hypothetical protein